jgi:hypothetical protein
MSKYSSKKKQTRSGIRKEREKQRRFKGKKTLRKYDCRIKKEEQEVMRKNLVINRKSMETTNQEARSE